MSDQNPQGPDQEEPKIIVDEDWKAQAEAEKQRLAEQDKTAASASAVEGQAAGSQAPGTLPPASFATLVSGLVTQILFAMGACADPQTGRRYRNLTMAKHHIDTLGVLEEKTKGNLTPEEKQVLDSALYEVRVAYMQAVQGGT